ncbi:MAG: hypothetical protein IE931_04485 [Sphingobacteriales bacterium]|nr:hypothetical protein [Sphingobacteriales bacterium]
MMMNLYCFPGLGADDRLFKRLQLNHYQIQNIYWLTPHQNESLADYSRRLIPQIDQTQPFALLGVSLGGIMVAELSHQLPAAHFFVISSVKSSKEFPFYLGLFRRLGFKYIISASFLKALKPMIPFLFGRMNKTDKQLIFNMIDNADPLFLSWAAKAILSWKSKDELTPFHKITQIVGDRDLIFRHAKLPDCKIIKGGTHVMILNRAGEVSAIINELSYSIK